MKVKDGKLKLGKGDTQVGNFVVSVEKMHYKMQDINAYWTMRVGFMHPMYTMIEECLKAKNYDYMEAFCKIMYAIGTAPADKRMLEDLYNAYNSLIGRMKEKGMIASDDNQALKQVEESYNAKEQLKEIAENGKPDNNTQG